MGFLFVRRSRYEALRNDLWQCQLALNKKSSEVDELKLDVEALEDDVEHWRSRWANREADWKSSREKVDRASELANELFEFLMGPNRVDAASVLDSE